MIETLLNEAEQAFQQGDKQRGEQLVQQIVQSPDEALPLMLEALIHRRKVKQFFPIQVIRSIGFPQNEPAIPALLQILGDMNHPAGFDAAQTLLDMGPDGLVPHLLRALLEKGEPYHTPFLKETMTWPWDVEGICGLITNKKLLAREAAKEYVLRCCPAINTLLIQAGSEWDPENNPDLEILLDVVEQAGEQVSYVLPTLIALVTNHRETEVGQRAKTLLFSFPQKELEPYRLLLHQLSI